MRGSRRGIAREQLYCGIKAALEKKIFFFYIHFRPAQVRHERVAINVTKCCRIEILGAYRQIALSRLKRGT